jgi:hypothetical protein
MNTRAVVLLAILFLSFKVSVASADAPTTEPSTTQPTTKASDEKQHYQYTKVDMDKVPNPVVAAVKQAIPTAKITLAQTRDGADPVVYRLHVSDGDKNYKFFVTADGKILKQVQKTD